MELKAKVLAIRFLDFEDNDGNPVVGHQIFVSSETDQSGWVQNVELLKCWVPKSSDLAPLADSLIPGDEVYISFNRKGKPQLKGLV